MTTPTFRFAPSPTGYLHIGGARTALYNWLVAKKTKGQFILRIEDTDKERSTDESIQAILDGMNWLGLDWDQGPYFQTKRFDLYKEAIDKLLAEKKAYPCFCTPETLDQKRKQAQAEKRKPKYDRTCAGLSDEEIQKQSKEGQPFCIRFLSPDDGEIVVNDLVKGQVRVHNSELDDLIIARSDGSPTYNLTVVVDDATMNLTHVVRGDDHLNNTFRQIQLYQALGYNLPQFAHLPMILGTDKKRLSKRHGATSVMAYKELGYLPEALINYLARVGWAYQDQEVFSRDELIEKFELTKVSKAAGVFNPEKLAWLNSVYINNKTGEELASLVLDFLKAKGIENPDLAKLALACEASKQKVKTLVELSSYVDFFFCDPQPKEELIQKHLNEKSKPYLQAVFDGLQNLSEWQKPAIEKLFKDLMAKHEVGLGKLGIPTRIALSGKKESPGLYDIILILGQAECLKRLGVYL